MDERFAVSVVAKGLEVVVRCNGIVVAATGAGGVTSVLRAVDACLFEGRNRFEAELGRPQADLPPEERVAEVALHRVGPGEEPSEVNAVVAFSYAANECRTGAIPETVLRHTFVSPRAGSAPWKRARALDAAEAARILHGALIALGRAIEERSTETILAMLEHHARDQAEVADLPREQVENDLLAPMWEVLDQPGGKLSVSLDALVVDVSDEGRLLSPRRADRGPVLSITSNDVSLPLFPTFALIDDRAHVVRWSA